LTELRLILRSWADERAYVECGSRFVIVGQIAHGATFEEILQGYPDLEKEDIQQAVEYAAWLTQEEIHFR